MKSANKDGRREGGLRGLYRNMFKASEPQRKQIFGKEGQIQATSLTDSKRVRSSWQSADLSNHSRMLHILESIGKEEEPLEGPQSINEAIQQYKDSTGKDHLETQERHYIEQDFLTLQKQRSQIQLNEQAHIDSKVKKLVGKTHRQVKRGVRIDSLKDQGAATARNPQRESFETQNYLDRGQNYNSTSIHQNQIRLLLTKSNGQNHHKLFQLPTGMTQQISRPSTQRDEFMNNNLMSQYEKRTVRDFDPHHFNQLFAGANSTNFNLENTGNQVLPSLPERAKTHRASQKPRIHQQYNKKTENNDNEGFMSDRRSKFLSSSTVNHEILSEKQIAHDFINPGILSKINQHKIMQSAINARQKHRSIQGRGSITGQSLSYVNPDEVMGEQMLRNFKNLSQRNHLNGLYWEYQNQEIREYDKKKQAEKLRVKHEKQILQTRDQAKRLKQTQQPIKNQTLVTDQSSFQIGHMNHIYKAIDSSQQDEDHFPQPQAQIFDKIDAQDSLQSNQEKDENVFSEILDSLDNNCSTSNIPVRRNHVQEFHKNSSNTKNSATNTSAVEYASSNKGQASQVQFMIGSSRNLKKQNKDLKSDLNQAKPTTLHQSRNALPHNEEQSISGEETHDFGVVTRNVHQRRVQQIGSFEISTQTLAVKNDFKVRDPQMSMAANKNGEFHTNQENLQAPGPIRIPEPMSSTEGSALPKEHSAYLRLSLEANEKQVSVATELRGTAIETSSPIFDQKPVVSVSNADRNRILAQPEIEQSGKARQVFKKLSFDKIEREISELQDLQMLDQINEMEERPAQQAACQSLRLQVLSIDPTVEIRKVKQNQQSSENRQISTKKIREKDPKGATSRQPFVKTANQQQRDQIQDDQVFYQPALELFGSSPTNNTQFQGLQTMYQSQMNYEAFGLGDRRSSKGFQFLGIPQRLKEQHVTNRKSQEQKHRSRGLKENQIREAVEAEQKQKVKIIQHQNPDISQDQNNLKQQHVLVSPGLGLPFEKECESANSTKLEVIVQHSSEQILDKIFTLSPEEHFRNADNIDQANDSGTQNQSATLNDISQEYEESAEAINSEQPIEKATIIYKEFEPHTGFRGKKMAKNDVLLKQHLLKPELGNVRQSFDSQRQFPLEVSNAVKKEHLIESSQGASAQESPQMQSTVKLDHHLPAKFESSEVTQPSYALKGSKKNKLLFGSKKNTTRNLAPWAQKSNRALQNTEENTPQVFSTSQGLDSITSPCSSNINTKEKQQSQNGSLSVPSETVKNPRKAQLCSFSQYVEENKEQITSIDSRQSQNFGKTIGIQERVEHDNDVEEKAFQIEAQQEIQMKDTSCQGNVETSKSTAGQLSKEFLELKLKDSVPENDQKIASVEPKDIHLINSSSTQLHNTNVSQPTMNDSSSIPNIVKPRFSQIQVTTLKKDTQPIRKKSKKMVHTNGSQMNVHENDSQQEGEGLNGVNASFQNTVDTMGHSPQQERRKQGREDDKFGRTVILSPQFGGKSQSQSKKMPQEYQMKKADISGFAEPFVAYYNSKKPYKLPAQSQRGPRPYRQIYGGGLNTKPKQGDQSQSSHNKSQAEELFELRKKEFEQSEKIVNLPAIPSFPKRQTKLRSQQKLYPLSDKFQNIQQAYESAKGARRDLEKIDENEQPSIQQTTTSIDEELMKKQQMKFLNIFKNENQGLTPGRSENNTIFDQVVGSYQFKSHDNSDQRKGEDDTPQTHINGKKTTISSQLTAHFMMKNTYLEEGSNNRNDPVKIQNFNSHVQNQTATPMSNHKSDLELKGKSIRKEKSNANCALE